MNKIEKDVVEIIASGLESKLLLPFRIGAGNAKVKSIIGHHLKRLTRLCADELERSQKEVDGAGVKLHDQRSLCNTLKNDIFKLNEKYEDYIPEPKLNFGQRLAFLFSNKLK